MDELLYLEPDEEITSVIEKLKGLPGKAVGLVVPKGASLIGSVVNLKLLARSAEQAGKEIAVITTDQVGTSLASQVGIPVYAAVGDAEPVVPVSRPKRPEREEVIELAGADEADESAGEPSVPVKRYDAGAASTVQAGDAKPPTNGPELSTPSPPARPRRRWHLRRGPVIAALLMGTGALLAWFFLVYPRATVTLVLVGEPVSETVDVTVDNNITEPDLKAGHVPGQKLQAEQVAKQSFEATGTKEVGTKAKGTVTVSNRLGQPITVPAGSTLRRDSLEFLTLAEVAVPAATVSLDATGNVIVHPGTKDVEIEASQPGSTYNLGKGEFVITSLKGSQQERVTAANSSPLAGGESRTVKVVTEENLATAREQIDDDVREPLLGQLEASAKGLTILGGTVEYTLTGSTASQPAGEEAESFELEATVRARTIGFAASQYQQMVVELVGRTLPAERELVVTGEDSVETQVASTTYDQGLLVLKATLRSESVPKLDQPALAQLIAGRSVSEAKGLLGAREGIESIDVALRPTFRSTIPKDPEQIRFVVERP